VSVPAAAAVEAPAHVERRVKDPAELELRGVCKNYGGLRAVHELSAVASPGEVLGIAGPNGAGKTTLFDVICGLTSSSGGTVLLGGVPIDEMKVHARCHLGLARTFQQPTVAGSLTVFENVRVARAYGRPEEHWTGCSDRRADIEWALTWCGLDPVANEPAGPLGILDKKRLMVATALVTGPRVMLFDEPFGGLNPDEMEQTLGLIRGVAELGVAVICIEHVMRAMVRLASRVLVMHHGSKFFEGTPAEMMRDERVIEIYLGRQGEGGRG
jgi:branched-chain amino acid transport system ATP-binding protein